MFAIGKHVEVDYWRESMQVLQHDPAFPGREVMASWYPLSFLSSPSPPVLALTGYLSVCVCVCVCVFL